MAPLRPSVPLLLLAVAALRPPIAGQEPAPPPGTPPAAAGTTGTVSALFTGRAARRDQCRDTKLVAAVRAGVAWLLAHQDADGRWDCAGYMKHDPPTDPCAGHGAAIYDAGVTALALLAVLAQADPLHGEAAHKAADWLVRQLDAKQGRLQVPAHDFLYSHVLATLALLEMSALHGNPRHRAGAEAALGYLAQHRNPYGAWRYQPRDNDNDTSLTAWCLAAFGEAIHAGFTVPADGVGIALGWLDSATDPTTGFAGYSKPGEPSARMPGGHDERFPVELGRAMTGAALHGRLLAGLPPDSPLALAAAARLLERPPEWRAAAADTYYWFHASAALALMPNCPASKRWEAALHKALLPAQGKDKSRQGSWDPVDVWGEVGGRVQTTAFAVLALSSPWRLMRCDAPAQVNDQVPLRKLFTLVQNGKVGEATIELGRIDAAAVPPVAAPGLARLRWLYEVACVHADHQLDCLATMAGDTAGRAAIADGIRTRFAGLTVGAKAALLHKQLTKPRKY